MTQKPFDKKLREHADKFRPEPRQDAWERIASNLPPERKKRRRLLLFLPVAASVLSAIVFVVRQNQREVTVASDVSAQKPAGRVEQPLYNLPDETNHADSNGTGLSLSVVTPISEIHKNPPPPTSENYSPEIHKNPENKLEPAYAESVKQYAEKIPAGFASNPERTDRENILHTNPAQSIVKSLPHPKNDSASVTKDSTVPVKSTKVKWMPVAGLAFHWGSLDTRVRSSQDSDPAYNLENQRQTYDRGREISSFGVYGGLEKGRIKYTLGVYLQNLTYQMPVVNTNKSILSGLTSQYQYFDFEATDSFKLAPPAEGAKYISNRFRHIVIPIGFHYHLLTHKNFSVYAHTNISMNVLTRYRGLTSRDASGIYVKQNDSKDGDAAKIYSAAGIGLNMQVKLLPTVHLVISPALGTSLSALDRGAVRTGIKSWTLGIGLEYKPDVKK